MSDNFNDRDSQNEDGGLFSNDYEAPKRENPYLKKNREKAKAEKAPKPEKPKRDKPARGEDGAVSPNVATADTPTFSEAPDAPDKEQGYVHKRTFSDFMFEHVRLIATIATIIVVLSLVLITDVVGLVENLITQSQQADKEEITLTYVQGLSEKAEPITWGDLSRFRRDETEADGSITWMISVKGTSYEVWISGVDTQKNPTYVYLFDMSTGDRMDLNEEDLDVFIESHS